MDNLGNQGNMGGVENKRSVAGYRYLVAYKLSVPVYDLTTEFVDKYIDRFSRTKDQMVQAARSGMQNILEGNQQQGIKGYIKLSGIARGSLEELLQDYLSFARQNKLELFDRNKCLREIEEISEIWDVINKNKYLPDIPYFPNLPEDRTKAVNLMITLVNQTNYFLDKLIISLKKKHEEKGGLTEELYRKRIEYRKKTQGY